MRYWNDTLCHSKGWTKSNHKYLSKYLKNGEWVYVYDTNGSGGSAGSTSGDGKTITETQADQAVSGAKEAAKNAFERMRKKNTDWSRSNGVKFTAWLNKTKSNIKKQQDANRRAKNAKSNAKYETQNLLGEKKAKQDAKKAAKGAIERLQESNARKSRTADIMAKHYINRTKSKVTKTVNNAVNTVKSTANNAYNTVAQNSKGYAEERKNRLQAKTRTRKNKVAAVKRDAAKWITEQLDKAFR